MLKQRVVTALLLVAVLVPVLFLLPKEVAVGAFAAIAAIAGWEWSRLSTKGRGHFLFPLWILACCGLCLLYPELQLPLCLLAVCFWLFVFVWLARLWQLPRGILGYAVGTLVLVPAWIGMVRLHAAGAWVLLAAMALVWVADIAAYFAGRAFGRHKLAPSISPGKTWEGAVGAGVGALVYAFLLARFGNVTLSGNGILLAGAVVLLVAISIVGDLFESMVKRQAGVKDSSQLLPGHGGVLDRIDSLTSTLPFVVVAGSFWPT